MALRGPKPRKIIDTTWSANLAYAVGLLASDGCLASRQSLIDLTSIDKDQLENYKKCLNAPHLKISPKTNGRGGVTYRVQFKNVLFYEWLQKIGLTPHKSKTLGAINIPRRYFFDFLRGLFDGDGSFYSYFDPRWKSSFMYYFTIASASPTFLNWLQSELRSHLGVAGHISKVKKRSCDQLRYAKAEASKIIKRMYYSSTVVCLTRKREKIEKALKVNDLTNSARVL